jgi:DNA-directed RNA polymerase specialized sigma24 family protein
LQTTFDAAWRHSAMSGDADAVKCLAAAVVQPLFGFCFYRVGRNRHLCEEVVQETLLRALRELDHYDPERANNNIFPWMSGLARNEIHRVLAREKSAVSLEALWARMDKELLTVYARLESEPFADELLQREETRELVNATMSST